LFACRRLLLACTAMRLTHPVSGEPLLLRAPLAEDFVDVLERLGWGAFAQQP
jgi:tRNA pseudouridine65 synthase